MTHSREISLIAVLTLFSLLSNLANAQGTGTIVVSGSVYDDYNLNGSKDSNEPLLPGRTVNVRVNDVLVGTILTGSNGTYTSNAINVSAGTLSVNLSLTAMGGSELVTGASAGSFDVSVQSSQTTTVSGIQLGVTSLYRTWTGTASNSFSDNSNWDRGSPNDTRVSADIGFQGIPPVLQGPVEVKDLNVTGTLHFGANAELSIYGAQHVTGSIDVDAGTHAIIHGNFFAQGPLNLSANSTLNVQGNLTTSGDVNLGAIFSAISVGGAWVQGGAIHSNNSSFSFGGGSMVFAQPASFYDLSIDGLTNSSGPLSIDHSLNLLSNLNLNSADTLKVLYPDTASITGNGSIVGGVVQRAIAQGHTGFYRFQDESATLAFDGVGTNPSRVSFTVHAQALPPDTNVSAWVPVHSTLDSLTHLLSADSVQEFSRWTIGRPTTGGGKPVVRRYYDISAQGGEGFVGHLNLPYDSSELLDNLGQESLQLLRYDSTRIPRLGADTASIVFEPTAVGHTNDHFLTLQSESNGTVIVQATLAQGTHFALVADTVNAEISGGDSLAVQVLFEPGSYGTFLDTLYLLNNSPMPLVKIPLSGSSPAPQLATSDSSLSFGQVALTDTVTRTLWMFNKSPVNPLTISSVVHGFEVYTYSVSLPLTIGANDSIELPITLNISSVTLDGYHNWNDTLVITSDGGLVPVTLLGSSPKPMIHLSPDLIVFPNTGIYDTSAVIVKVANTSPNALHIDSIVTRTQNFTPSFHTLSLPNKDTADLIIRFVPTRFGAETDSVKTWSNSDFPLNWVDVSGYCPYPAIVTDPPTINFGNAHKDSTIQRIFSIQDTSISRLQIDSLWTGTKYFDVVHHLANWIVKKGDSVAVSIRFTPDSGRQYFDTLYIANTSPLSPAKIPLAGVGATTGVLQFGSDIPTVYTLFQNYPNPFNPSTTIGFGVPERSNVRVTVYNVLGQEVTQLVNQSVKAGYYENIWNGNVASGLYFYRIKAVSLDDPNKAFVDVKKMILLK